MSEIPYTPTPGKIKEYFEKFQQVGNPTKVNRQWLELIGFKGGNDTYIISVLKFIGFIDSSNAPTEVWKLYKDTIKGRVVLARAIAAGYKELFSTYQDANRQNKEVIYAFFSSKTGKAKDTVERMVSTFTNLCQLADFEAGEIKIAENEPKGFDEEKKDTKGRKTQMTPQMPEGFAVNMNIQITLPVTEDAKVYENIFKALREQLFKSD